MKKLLSLSFIIYIIMMVKVSADETNKHTEVETIETVYVFNDIESIDMKQVTKTISNNDDSFGGEYTQPIKMNNVCLTRQINRYNGVKDTLDARIMIKKYLCTKKRPLYLTNYKGRNCHANRSYFVKGVAKILSEVEGYTIVRSETTYYFTCKDDD